MADRVEEIVIENRNRATLIVLCSFGLVLVGCFLFPSIYVLVTKPGAFLSLEGVVMLVAPLAFLLLLLWVIYSLIRNPHYLETQPEGVVFGGKVRCYCTWDNIKDIHMLPYELHNRGGRVGMFYAVVIDFHSFEELYFDSFFDRMLSRKAITDNQLKLYLRGATSLSPEQVCEDLRERWKKVIPASNVIASIPLAEDAGAKLVGEIKVTRNDAKTKNLYSCLLAFFAVVLILVLKGPGEKDWGRLLFVLFGMGVAAWGLLIILPGKPLLETSPGGVALCGLTGRCFVPWDNIKEIGYVTDRWQRYSKLPSQYPDKWIKFRFHNTRDVRYDNLLYRIVGKLFGPSFYINPIGGESNVSMDLVEALKERLERSRSGNSSNFNASTEE